MLVFLVRPSADGEPGRRRGVAIAWAVGGILLVVGIAVGLGAGGIIDRFKSGTVVGDVRFQLWRDALRILAVHPAGIGRGAFNHVYPIYRTVKNEAFSITYAYLENHPLQLLVDSGVVLFLAVVAGIVIVVREIVLRGRRDRIEAALLAALSAVTVHSFVDFGLETLGVSAAVFAAILGTVLGRRPRGTEAVAASRGATFAVVGVTCAGLLFGAASIAHRSDDNFEDAIKETARDDQEPRASSSRLGD